MDTMPKIQIFLWQVCHKALPTRALLHHRGIQVETTCPLCKGGEETLDHLFLGCPYVIPIWRLADTHA